MPAVDFTEVSGIFRLDNFGGEGLVYPFSAVYLKWSYGDFGWRSSMVEHLICNEEVGGSSPFASSRIRVRRDRGKTHRFSKNLKFVLNTKRIRNGYAFPMEYRTV